MILADSNVKYEPKEALILIAAIAWVIALGGIMLASWSLCGWQKAKSVAVDFWHAKVTFGCR